MEELFWVYAFGYFGVGFEGFFGGCGAWHAGFHWRRFADGGVAVVAQRLSGGPFAFGFYFHVVILQGDHIGIDQGGDSQWDRASL